MAVLRALQGGNPGQVFPLEGEVAVLGRHPDCDILLESGAVSRHHARIMSIAGDYFVEDLRSRNGTFVNGEPVVGRRRLGEDDRLSICELVFAFHDELPESTERLSDDLGHTTAIVFDDDKAKSNSTIMSRLDTSGVSTALRSEQNAEAKLRALIEISQSLSRVLSLDKVLPTLLDSLFKIFLQADRGFVILKDARSGRLVPKAVKYRHMDDEQTVRISRTIVQSVMDSKEAVLSADAAADDRFDMAESIVDFHIRSMMCAPLLSSEGEALGVIQIDTLDQRSRFDRDDLDVLASVASQAAAAVENAQLHETALRERALERDLAVAHEVQRGLLPAVAPTIDGYEFFEFYKPARKLGGDYYDYVSLPDGRIAVVVADVSGKGIAASLLMARFSAETRFCLAAEPSPGKAVARLNRIFCGSTWEDRFITLALCVVDPRRHEVVVVNAGHMPPLLCRPGEPANPIGGDQTQLPIGVDDDVAYPETTVATPAKASIILYTDGITEAMNLDGDLYGEEHLLAQLGRCDESPSAIGKAVLDDVQEFVGNRTQSDDMCLVCFGRR
jgi:serine phosphatase RsbU (regulator of sigma subunit)